jgi:hypothetical protein
MDANIYNQYFIFNKKTLILKVKLKRNQLFLLKV